MNNTLERFNKEYYDISSVIKNITDEIYPLEQILLSKSFAFETEEDALENNYKGILLKAKELNITIKAYEQKVKSDDINKRIFIPKVKILKEKYATLLKKIIILNDKYNSHNNNIKKISSVINDTENQTENTFIDKQMQSNIQTHIQTQSDIFEPNDVVINMYAYNKTRNEEIQKLSGDIHELYEIFQEFSVLINSQHQEIQSIEDIIGGTHRAIENGNKKLYESVLLQKKMRKKKCCIAIVCIIILLVIVLTGGSILYKFL